MSDTEVCTIDGCGGKFLAKGLCRKHYSRQYRHGTTTALRTSPGEVLEWVKAHLSTTTDDCLDWPYARMPNGYGVMSFEGRMHYAGWVMCRLSQGPAPSDIHEAAHNCGRGHLGCANPRHMRWATPAENQADRLLHGTDLRGEAAPWSKLTEAQVIEIRALSSHTLRRDIAARFGVSTSAIDLIVNGKRWTHVGGASHG